jgi:hypothetical protein
LFPGAPGAILDPVAAAHRIVVEAPPAAAVEALAEQAARLGSCTCVRRGDGTGRVELEYREEHEASVRRISLLSHSLTTVERWLRQQPVSAVTVWVDGRRFALTRRDAAARKRTQPDQTAARTASS